MNKIYIVITCAMIVFLIKSIVGLYNEGPDSVDSMKTYRENVLNLSNYLKESQNVEDNKIKNEYLIRNKLAPLNDKGESKTLDGEPIKFISNIEVEVPYSYWLSKKIYKRYQEKPLSESFNVKSDCNYEPPYTQKKCTLIIKLKNS